MERVDSNYMFFFDDWVIPMIMEKYKLSEETALRKFIFSETYKMLSQPNLKLYWESPLFIFDMYENEVEKGDPRKSSYIQGDTYEG
ncbi:MAG: hypothetical protein LBR36_04845 [Bacteroidales bacterium]|jgi:hypothetical protein|nr:hypothetical protein [Bacteroidales bacterium]